MIKDILLCQIIGPLFILDLPSFSSLEIFSVTEAPREKVYNLFDKAAQPKRLIIIGKRNKLPFTIEVNLETNTLHYFPYDLVFDKGPSNSGELGAIILGLPGIVLALPLLLPALLVQKIIKLSTGLSWHSLVFLSKIKQDLLEEQLFSLKSALKHDDI